MKDASEDENCSNVECWIAEWEAVKFWLFLVHFQQVFIAEEICSKLNK